MDTGLPQVPGGMVWADEIDTEDRITVGYWQFLAAEYHVPSDARYVP